MKVVSNTSPLRYLITIGQSDLIQRLFGQVLIPRGVEAELTHPSAPTVVRRWMAQRPPWIDVRDLVTPPELALLQHLDAGEAEAIQMAIDVNADFLIMDERSGREVATTRHITVVGILGILLESYRRGAVRSPADIISQLQTEGFRISRRLRLQFQEQIASVKPKSK